MNSTVLVTGSAGFIGYHLCKRLLDSGNRMEMVKELIKSQPHDNGKTK